MLSPSGSTGLIPFHVLCLAHGVCGAVSVVGSAVTEQQVDVSPASLSAHSNWGLDQSECSPLFYSKWKGGWKLTTLTDCLLWIDLETFPWYLTQGRFSFPYGCPTFIFSVFLFLFFHSKVMGSGMWFLSWWLLRELDSIMDFAGMHRNSFVNCSTKFQESSFLLQTFGEFGGLISDPYVAG